MMKYVRKAGMMTADMAGSTVMMDVETGKYYNLGDVGGSIWEMMDAPLTMDELVEKLTAAYDVAPEQCRCETQAFVDSLVERGLVLVQK